MKCYLGPASPYPEYIDALRDGQERVTVVDIQGIYTLDTVSA